MSVHYVRDDEAFAITPHIVAVVVVVVRTWARRRTDELNFLIFAHI